MTWEDILKSDKALMKAIVKNNGGSVIARYNELTGSAPANTNALYDYLKILKKNDDPLFWNILEVPWNYGQEPLIDDKVDFYSPIQQSLSSAIYNARKMTIAQPILPDSLVKNQSESISTIGFAIAAFVGFALVYLWIVKGKK